MVSVLPGPQDRMLPKAKLEDVQGNGRRDGASVFRTTSAGEAIAILKSSAVTSVAVMVQWSQFHSSYLPVPKVFVIERLSKQPATVPIVCDLDKDGWCWIGGVS